MNVGWIGLGKLGLPCAVALEAAGHDVVGYDVAPEPARYLTERRVPYQEERLPELLEHHGVKVGSIDDVVAHASVIFVAVQTPHDPDYDGTKPAPALRRDFEYGYLRHAVECLARSAKALAHHVEVVVVSTVLPGTFDRELRPLANEYVTLIYNPFFIAMGTTVADFTDPEFVLLGMDDIDADAEPSSVELIYGSLHTRPIRRVSIASAELTKVAYNVSLSSKIAFANYLGEVCAKTGADVDEVTDSLALATDRILSPRYTRAGMGDGGGCHPRDLIALSYMAERLALSFDFADVLMEAREMHSDWLASIVEQWQRLTRKPVILLGRSYKPETNLTLGSPAALLMHHLTERDVKVEAWLDPHVDDLDGRLLDESDEAIYVVATAHQSFATHRYAHGSVVIDPFGFVLPQEPEVTVVRPGRKR